VEDSQRSTCSLHKVKRAARRYRFPLLFSFLAFFVTV
jgi:hypothetical protein